MILSVGRSLAEQKPGQKLGRVISQNHVLLKIAPVKIAPVKIVLVKIALLRTRVLRVGQPRLSGENSLLKRGDDLIWGQAEAFYRLASPVDPVGLKAEPAGPGNIPSIG